MNQALNISSLNKNHRQVNSPSYLQVAITKFKAQQEAKRIIKSLKEVKDFESGKKQPKSFDDFLSEI